MTGFAVPPPFDPGAAETLLEPEQPGEGNWLGAPCVHRHAGETYLCIRERTPEQRGRAVILYRRTGTTDFDEIGRITADELGVVSVERPSLVTDPVTGDAKLYLPVDYGSNEWTIQKLADAATPTAFDPGTAHDVLRPTPGGTDQSTVKDPYIIIVGGRYYMFYCGSDGRSEQAHLATSVDGTTWQRAPGNPIIGRQYWHDHHTRVSCVFPALDAPVWLVLYEGSGVYDYGKTWNIRTATAVTSDLTTFVDTSPAGPRYAAPTADALTGVDTFATCRYMDVLRGDDHWDVFAEIAREDGSFSLRWQRIGVDRIRQGPNALVIDDGR